MARMTKEKELRSAANRAAQQKREQRLRERGGDEWGRFDRLTRDLLKVPKSELDKKRKQAS